MRLTSLLVLGAALSGCSKWTTPQEVVAEVVEVRVAARLSAPAKGAPPAKSDKTADTIAGAAVGWFILGGPLGVAAGAAIGASDDSAKPIAASELLGCRMTVKVGDTRVVFTYIGECRDEDITQCSLRRPGDRLRVQELRYRGDDLPPHQRVAYGTGCSGRDPFSCDYQGEILP